MKKPEVKYNSQGQDGNVFNILVLCQKELRNQGKIGEYKKMRIRVLNSHSYEEALGIIREYVDLVDTIEKL